MKEDLSKIPWGTKFKWGIVKRYDRALTFPIDSYGRRILPYYVVEHSVAAFAPKNRQVALNLTHEEAEALCTILNAGGTSG